MATDWEGWWRTISRRQDEKGAVKHPEPYDPATDPRSMPEQSAEEVYDASWYNKAEAEFLAHVERQARAGQRTPEEMEEVAACIFSWREAVKDYDAILLDSFKLAHRVKYFHDRALAALGIKR